LEEIGTIHYNKFIGPFGKFKISMYFIFRFLVYIILNIYVYIYIQNNIYIYYFEATYNEARDIEIQALNISTNDEDAFEAITNKATNCKPLPMKHAINKPRRLCSSDEEYDKKSCKYLVILILQNFKLRNENILLFNIFS